jgi:hypothetical protein
MQARSRSVQASFPRTATNLATVSPATRTNDGLATVTETAIGKEASQMDDAVLERTAKAGRVSRAARVRARKTLSASTATVTAVTALERRLKVAWKTTLRRDEVSVSAQNEQSAGVDEMRRRKRGPSSAYREAGANGRSNHNASRVNVIGNGALPGEKKILNGWTPKSRRRRSPR